MRILIIDDSQDWRDTVEAILLDAGYEDISKAASATEAFALLTIGPSVVQKPFPIDLVLLDVVMPEIDGVETCARIRNDARYADVPIIMVTSLTDMDSLANAFVAGATDYITKPLKRIELLSRVRSALKLKSEFDRRRARELELLTLVSNAGGGRAAHMIDDATGFLAGEVAEAYLTAPANLAIDADTSVIALSIDRLDAYRSTQGEAVATHILAQVADAIRATASTVGVLAAAYRSGVIVLVAPELRAKPAKEFGEMLRAEVSALAIDNAESIAADHVTASVAVVTGRVDRYPDRTHLLTRALKVVPQIAAAGGNRVVVANA